jgi:RNA polymerase sigma-70 factor (ECF subfamily)
MSSGAAVPRLSRLLGERRPTVATLGRNDSDDTRLVAGISDREPWAIAELFDRYSAVVRRMLFRTLGSETDLDDLAQETFLTVIRRCSTLREPQALPGFVVGVAVRTAQNEMRRRSLRRFVGLEHVAVTGTEHDPEQRQQVTRAYALLQKLDATSRIVFVLRFVEELGLPEIAKALDISLATAKRRLARAERRFEAMAAADPVLRDYLREGS